MLYQRFNIIYTTRLTAVKCGKTTFRIKQSEIAVKAINKAPRNITIPVKYRGGVSFEFRLFLDRRDQHSNWLDYIAKVSVYDTFKLRLTYI